MVTFVGSSKTDMLDVDSRPFDDFERVLDRAVSVASAYLASLPERPVAYPVTPAEMSAALAEPLPEYGVDPAGLADEWFARAERGIVASSGPRFYGWMIGGSTPAALAGDWIASTIDQNTGGWQASPAGVQTEAVVVDWLKELLGVPQSWAGVLTSGATMSNLVGLAAGRQWVAAKLGFDAARDGLGGHPAIPVISSTEIHASTIKSLGTLGIGRNSVHVVPAHGGRIDLGAFERTLAATPGPAIVVANAGDVNTGAFDDIEGMAAVCRRHPGGVWLHVDGAFGLYAAVSPTARHLLRGIEQADSVGSDAHKWLNVPYDSGFVFVRDHEAVESAFTVAAAYIHADDADHWNPVLQSRTPELSRRARGLSVWFGLKSLGRRGLQELVERNLAQAREMGDWIDEHPGLELCAPVHLNIACFRYRPREIEERQLDEFNRDAVAALQADGRIFVTGTEWQGQHCIRIAFDNWSTGPRDLKILREAILDIGQKMLSGHRMV